MSNPKVTITLGRTGQVVTKEGKRSRGEGVSGNGKSYLFSGNKRFRGEGMKWSPVVIGVNGSGVAKNDLRLKLMRKRQSKTINNVVDERGKIKHHGKLLRAIQPPISSAESLGKYHSHQSMEVSRARYADQSLRSYSSLSPLRNFDEIQRVMPMRTADISRQGQVLRGPPRAMLTATSSPGNLVTQVAPASSIIQAVSNMGEECQTVDGFLHSLGLGKYVVNFQAEEVDMTVLKQMGDKDLKEMGIPMGPRKKILLALVARMKWQTSRLQH